MPHEVENKIEEIKQIIRRSETNKAKVEARLELLREGGSKLTTTLVFSIGIKTSYFFFKQLKLKITPRIWTQTVWEQKLKLP